MFTGLRSVPDQGGYNVGTSGNWAVKFPNALLAISGDYSGSGGMDWGPSIWGSTTAWGASSEGSGLRVLSIGY